MKVNETVDQLIKDEMEVACNNITFLRECIALPSFTDLKEVLQEQTSQQLEHFELRLEALKQYFSLPENPVVRVEPNN